MNEIVRYKLIELARSKQTIQYQQLSDICNLNLTMKSVSGRNAIGKILADISYSEHSAERPLLSVLVIQKASGKPGIGFYKICENLGFGKSSKLKNKRGFIKDQEDRCFDFWSKEQN